MTAATPIISYCFYSAVWKQLVYIDLCYKPNKSKSLGSSQRPESIKPLHVWNYVQHFRLYKPTYLKLKFSLRALLLNSWPTWQSGLFPTQLPQHKYGLEILALKGWTAISIAGLQQHFTKNYCIEQSTKAMSAAMCIISRTLAPPYPKASSPSAQWHTHCFKRCEVWGTSQILIFFGIQL